MVDKISFPFSDDWGVIGPDGDHALPVVSELGHRFQLVGGAVVDRYNGVTDDEVKALDAEQDLLKQADDLNAARDALVVRVKIEAGERIVNLDWKVARAKEQDALNATTTLQVVYAEREVIRVASGEAEIAIAALTTLDEIEVTYRPYLSTDLQGPQMDPPITLGVNRYFW